MCLSQVETGSTCKICELRGSGPIRQRLIDLGIMPNVQLKVERKAPGGDPIWVNLGGWQVALRQKEADSIIVATTGMH